MKTLQLKGMQALTKMEMKHIIGAVAAPAAPIAGFGVAMDDGGGYKCCWSNDLSNCSDCSYGANSSWTCVSGASLISCNQSS